MFSFRFVSPHFSVTELSLPSFGFLSVQIYGLNGVRHHLIIVSFAFGYLLTVFLAFRYAIEMLRILNLIFMTFSKVENQCIRIDMDLY